MELVQVRFVVENFGAAFRFYRDVLGLAPQVDDDRGPYGKLSFPAGEVAIALQTRDAIDALVGPIGACGQPCIAAVRVADLDSAVGEIRARGGVPLGAPVVVAGRMRAAYLRDPSGNLIELQEWLAGRPARAASSPAPER